MLDGEQPLAEEALPTAVEPKPLTKPHLLVVGAILVAAAILTGWWLLSGQPERVETTAPAAAATPSVSTTTEPAPTAEVVIDVVGKVEDPGIVTLPEGSRVTDAIDAAGGLKGKPDTTALNMARVLSDGEQILVGIEPVGAGAPAAPGAAPGQSGPKVNLNTATAEQLDVLPGVGPVTAAAILSWRDENGRFGRIEDLLEVKGIGPATMAELEPLVAV